MTSEKETAMTHMTWISQAVITEQRMADHMAQAAAYRLARLARTSRSRGRRRRRAWMPAARTQPSPATGGTTATR
jgi:hypothetical protein